MGDEVYKKMCETMAKRRGGYPGMDIPEFYPMAKALFTPEEAEVNNAFPRGPVAADALAKEMGKERKELEEILEEMANKGLCVSVDSGGVEHYMGAQFVPGIFEFQFMRGTSTERDRELARLIHTYKEAVDNARVKEEQKITFPGTRVITVEESITPGSKVHIYDQVSSYIEKYDPIAVGTCFCRHEAKLVDEKDDCGMPDDVCMQFGMTAEFGIKRLGMRKLTKKEAMEVLNKAEEAGLVHMGMNTQEITFMCNCCKCHCMAIKPVLKQPKPGLVFNSGFKPVFDADLCTACETCIDRCPADAMSLDGDGPPEVDMDRCFGCGVCATGCSTEAIMMEAKPDAMDVPQDTKALKEAIKASLA